MLLSKVIYFTISNTVGLNYFYQKLKNIIVFWLFVFELQKKKYYFVKFWFWQLEFLIFSYLMYIRYTKFCIRNYHSSWKSKHFSTTYCLYIDTNKTKTTNTIIKSIQSLLYSESKMHFHKNISKYQNYNVLQYTLLKIYKQLKHNFGKKAVIL